MMENCSFNSTFTNVTCGADKESDVKIWVTTEEAIGISVLSACSAIVGSVGNLLVLIAVATSRYLRTVPDFFIVSLSIADALNTAIAQPMLIYQTFYYPLEAKITRDAFNVTTSFVGHLALIASVTSMTAVTIDRLVAIRFAFRYASWVTTRVSAVAIVFTWLVSLAMTLVYTVPENVDRMGLWAYVTMNLLVTISTYVYIFSVARRQANKIVAVQPQMHNKPRQNARDQRGERKAAKTIAIIVGVFLLFWLPLILYAAIYGSQAASASFLRGFRWVQAVSMCNSAINPYVYCIRSVRYRRAFAEIMGLKNTDTSQSFTFQPNPKTHGSSVVNC